MKLYILALVLLSSGSYSMPSRRTGKFFIDLKKCFPDKCLKVIIVPLYCLFLYDPATLPCNVNKPGSSGNRIAGFLDLFPRGVEESYYNATDLNEQIEVLKQVILNDQEYAIFRLLGNQTLQRITNEELKEDTLGPL